MVALICCTDKYKKDHIDFSLILPSANGTKGLFLNSNWAHFIDPENFPPSTYCPRKHNPAKRFTNFEDQANLVNEVMDTIISNLTGFSRPHLSAIEWSLNEITDNVLMHSQSELGGIIQVTSLKNRKTVEFVVGDAGIGIAQSLRSSHREMTSDADALSRAIQEGVTRDKAIGQGNGLYGTYKIAVESSGNFSLHANNATLYFAETTGMHSRSEFVPFYGSIVTCGIDYTSTFLLDKALRFSDKPHTPIDMIDIKYESGPDGSILFSISDETPSVGSRKAGEPIRNKLSNLLRISGANQICIDFSGIHLISSSFADEVFGKLFITLGALEFSSRFQFKNTDQIVKKLIDKAIMQRMASATRE